MSGKEKPTWYALIIWCCMPVIGFCMFYQFLVHRSPLVLVIGLCAMALAWAITHIVWQSKRSQAVKATFGLDEQLAFAGIVSGLEELRSDSEKIVAENA